MRNLFKLNCLTYLFLILSMLSGYIRETIVAYIIIILHEFGHYIIMKLYNIKINKITIYPYGGVIDSDILINTNSYKILIISFGGIIMQLLLFLIFFILYKIGLLNTYYYLLFNKLNTFLILFNLLPIYPLDGFKIVNSVLELLYPFKVSLLLSIIFNIFFIIIFIIYILINKVGNYIVIIFLLHSFIKYMKSSKYLINKFYVERIIYDIEYIGLVSVKNKNNMYKNKLNYINGIREDIYLKKYMI